MIREFLYREDEVCLLVRREDSFPVATVGNTQELFGITDEAFSRDDTELFRAMKEPEKGYAFFRKYGVWDGKTPLSAEIEMKNGKMTTLTAVRCHDDNFDIFLFKDITDEYKKEQEYEEKLKNTEEESHFKTSFLFRMSHEIRTPMNGITGMLELAKRKTEENHPARQYLDKVVDGNIFSVRFIKTRYGYMLGLIKKNAKKFKKKRYKSWGLKSPLYS